MSVIETVRETVSLVKKIDNIELYRKILDLQAEIQKVVDENHEWKSRVKELERHLEIKEALIFRDNDYWVTKADGTSEGPFCSVCWDVEGKLVRLHKVFEDSIGECYKHKKPEPGTFAVV